MQSKNPHEEAPTPLRKEWRPPQCSRKIWSTPKLVSLEFNQTQDGIFANVPENSSGTLAHS